MGGEREREREREKERETTAKTLVSDDGDPEFESHSERDFFRRVSKAFWAPKHVLSQTDV